MCGILVLPAAAAPLVFFALCLGSWRRRGRRRDRLRRRRRRHGNLLDSDHRPRRRRRRRDRLHRHRRRHEILFENDRRRRRPRRRLVVVTRLSCLGLPPRSVEAGPLDGPDLGGPKTAQIGPGLAGDENVSDLIRLLIENQTESGGFPNRRISPPGPVVFSVALILDFCRTSAVKLRNLISGESFASMYLSRCAGGKNS